MGNAWSLNVNVSGVKPFEPGAFIRIPTGAYRVEIADTEMEQKDPSKAASLRFDVKIAEEGDFKGVTTRVYVGTDQSKDGNRKHLRALLLGVGANVTALDAGNIQITNDMFVGKPAYIYVEAAPEGEKTADGKRAYDNRNFIAPAYYEKWRTENAQPVHAGGAAQGAQGAAPAPANLSGLAGALGSAGQGAQGGAAFPNNGSAPQPGTGPKLF